MAKGRRKRQGLLGVEFYDSEIRVVEIRYSSGKPIVLAAGSTAMPPNALVDGEVVRADAVAFALRKLIENLGITSKDAVLGIPISGYATRSLNIPPTPPDEQAMLIEGEVRHFDILRTPEGAYDFFPLATNDVAETSIVLMAAEGPITTSIRSVAERAGLDVVALEPITTGMLRTAAASGVSAPEGLFLAVGESSSEASIIRDGRVWLYRRIEVGVNALFSTGHEATRVDHTLSKEEEEELKKGDRPRELRKGPADSLGIEVRRTMEFYAREFAGANPVTVVNLILNDTILDPIEPFLRDATGSEILVVRPGGFIAQSDTAAQELASDLGYRYSGAFGLAIHGMEGPAEVIPTLDLYVRERSNVAMELKRKTFAGSLAAAIVAVVLGIGGSYYFGTQAKNTQGQLDNKTRELQALQKVQQDILKSGQETIEQIAFLSTQGIPAVWFIDRISSSIDAGVGFNQIQFENEASVTLNGEAKNVQSLVLTVERLQSQPELGFATVHSYERIDKETNDPSIRFTLKMIRGPGPTSAPAPVPQGGAQR